MLALDRSLRTTDVDGRLHVERSNISKACVNPYLGSEIPGFAALGLDPARIYQMYRDPGELALAAPTFERLPILSTHEPVSIDDHRPDLVVGAIGSNVEFCAPYLTADLVIWDAAAVAGIETAQVVELSCGYRFTPDMTPGEADGVPYDGRMTQIIANHLALVERGRAGPDVLVADAAPKITNPPPRVEPMKMTKLGAALLASLGLASQVLAADSALPALVATASRKTLKTGELKRKLLAMDADLDPEKLDKAVDSIADLDEEDEDPEAKKPAEDECDEDEEDKLKAAMDSLRSEFRAAAEAREDVRAVVGPVFGMDSAEEIYSFALDHLKADRADVTGVPALKALFKLAAKPAPQTTITQDSAATTVPANVSRFRRI